MNKPLMAVVKTTARYGLFSVLSVGGLMAAEQDQKKTEEKKDEAVKIEKFEVTGSRIKRVDYETPAPVATFTNAEIEAKGYTNVGDFIQSLPFNSGTANSIYQTASFLRGAATTNLRGLGSQRFLTLVNGRRATPYALTNSGNRSVFDFNSLPAAAIESIELLKDGASAIYGSDAITGVLNIKLKKNFTGLSVGAYYGNTERAHGGDTGIRQVSIVAGAETGKTKIITAIDAKMANSNFLRDYGVTSTDWSALGTAKGSNLNSTSNWPANLTLTRAQFSAIPGLNTAGIPASATSWTFVVNGGKPNAVPTISAFVPAPTASPTSTAVLVGNENRYNFAETYQIYPAYDYISNHTAIEQAFTDDLKGFFELTFGKNSTYYAFTPGVITYSTEGLTLPATNPYNPFGIPLTTLTARTNFGPVRKFDTEATNANFLAGFRGTILNKWDWESAVNYGFSNVSTVSRNAIRATVYQAALNGTTRATALNPFGPSDNQSIVNGLFTISNASAKIDSLSYDASASGKVFELPAGEVGVAAGVEIRNDRLVTNPDTAAYLGSGGGLPLSGKRVVSSQYVEITAPLYKTKTIGSAELQLAGRHEHYSDFGDTTKPKVGLKLRLPDTKFVNVLLRGSYSESFQAPALGLLYASQTVAFSSTVLQDPLRPQDSPVQQRVVTGGNPNLLPETAKIQYVGAVFESPRIKDLSFSVDFFNMRINQVIVTPSATFLLSAAGRAQFPNAIVRDNTLGNPGPILRIDSVPSNNPLAYQLYRGIDYEVKYTLRNTRAGDFRFSAGATQIIKYGSDSGLGAGFFNNTGLYYTPEWKGSVGTSWNYKHYGAALSADYTHHYYNDGYTGGPWGENPFTLIAGNVRYNGFWNTTVTLGVNNMFNTRPPANGRETTGFDPNAYGAAVLGRFWYVRVRKDF